MTGDEREMSNEQQAAPGALETVRAFINTRDIEDGTDDIDSPERLSTWLTDHGVMPSGTACSAEELALAIDTREALRALTWANNGDEHRSHDLSTLNRAAALAELTLHFDAGSDVTLQPAAPGVKGALGTIVAIVADAMKEGTWNRLKACRNEDCGWAFYDHARNRSAKWCTMAVCGNRMKARAFRARHTEASDA
jgi:predicted RNA-binding Zn ribbon-like protein